MGRRLILDTNILIAYERGTIDRSALDDDELSVASITIAEYRTGIELADTPERAAKRWLAILGLHGCSAKMAALNIVNFVTNCAPKRIRNPFSRHQIALQNVPAETPPASLCRSNGSLDASSETPAVAA